jgi:hypothetical protein
MNARTFGTTDGLAEFKGKYGSDDYETVGRAIAEAQTDPSDAWVADQLAIAAAIKATADRSPGHFSRATPNAINYLVSLARTRTPDVQPVDIRKWADSVDRTEVSVKIDWLKTQPAVFAGNEKPGNGSLERHNVPAGRYAITGNEGHTVFVKIDIPTEGRWAGRIFVKVQAGDDLHRTSRDMADALLAKIAAAGTKDAMLRYGREIGACGHCGRTLTNEESRAAGIGPVCRGKMGW